MLKTIARHRKEICRNALGMVAFAALIAAMPAIRGAEGGGIAGPPRAAIPDPDLLKQAEAKVRDAHRKDFAKAKLTADRLALAQRLLEKARAMKEPSLACCATLTLARDLAVELGNPELMDQSIDALAQRFDVDGPALKNKRSSRPPRPPALRPPPARWLRPAWMQWTPLPPWNSTTWRWSTPTPPMPRPAKPAIPQW